MFFKKKKQVIKNPDEYVIRYMKHKETKYIDHVLKTDSMTLSKILAQFDIKNVCSFLVQLPAEKSMEIFKFFSIQKQEEVLNKLPSKYAANFLQHTMKH